MSCRGGVWVWVWVCVSKVFACLLCSPQQYINPKSVPEEHTINRQLLYTFKTTSRQNKINSNSLINIFIGFFFFFASFFFSTKYIFSGRVYNLERTVQNLFSLTRLLAECKLKLYSKFFFTYSQ